MILLLEPHNDDVALFAAFTAQARPGRIVTCLRSFRQERLPTPIRYPDRERESEIAAGILNCSWTQWDVRDDLPVATMAPLLYDRIALMLQAREWGHVYAPAIEPDGHEHHSLVGEIAADLVPSGLLTHYMTYRRGHGRTETHRRVKPEPEWIARKLRALACFKTQHAEPTTQPWFLDGLDEWLA
jgi:LmbE family N-acetylglucosaminyl deacetylase